MRWPFRGFLRASSAPLAFPGAPAAARLGASSAPLAFPGAPAAAHHLLSDPPSCRVTYCQVTLLLVEWDFPNAVSTNSLSVTVGQENMLCGLGRGGGKGEGRRVSQELWSRTFLGT